MAHLANEINGASSNADLDRRNDGIALTDYNVVYNHPPYINYKWSSHKRSPNKFTVWLRNVKTQEYYKAEATVWTKDGQGRVETTSLPHKTGEYQLVLTKYNSYNDVYARSSTFWIYSGDF